MVWLKNFDRLSEVDKIMQEGFPIRALPYPYKTLCFLGVYTCISLHEKKGCLEEHNLFLVERPKNCTYSSIPLGMSYCTGGATFVLGAFQIPTCSDPCLSDVRSPPFSNTAAIHDFGCAACGDGARLGGGGCGGGCGGGGGGSLLLR